jgi:hypothetical protein
VNLQETGSPTTPDSTDCAAAKGGGGVPGSYNLYSAMPCLAGINLSTAVLLSSRFPFVTPSGVARNRLDNPNCQPAQKATDQLIDGGYAENSGLGTLDDLSSDLMPLVRQHNARQIAAGSGDIHLVVPVVVSIDSTPRAENPGPRSSSSVPELLVPVYGGLRRGATLSDPDSLIQRSLDSTEDWLPDSMLPCPTAEQGSAAACSERQAAQAAVEATFSGRSVDISPVQEPQIAAPLGWVLSDASRSSLDNAITQQVDCRTLDPNAPCAFGTLLAKLRT